MNCGRASACPAAANSAAEIGDAALVPPTSCHPPCLRTYVATPVAGSAIAEMSADARVEHGASFGPHTCFAITELHALPAPLHAVFVVPSNDVPPTATTYADVAGYSAPPAKPLSPVDANVPMPGLL